MYPWWSSLVLLLYLHFLNFLSLEIQIPNTPLVHPLRIELLCLCPKKQGNYEACLNPEWRGASFHIFTPHAQLTTHNTPFLMVSIAPFWFFVCWHSKGHTLILWFSFLHSLQSLSLWYIYDSPSLTIILRSCSPFVFLPQVSYYLLTHPPTHTLSSVSLNWVLSFTVFNWDVLLLHSEFFFHVFEVLTTSYYVVHDAVGYFPFFVDLSDFSILNADVPLAMMGIVGHADIGWI